MANKGNLFLIPTLIAADTAREVLPAGLRERLPAIRHFLAEDVRSARRFLSSLRVYEKIEDLWFSVLDKDTADDAIEALFSPVFEGYNLGVISESGCPGIADPGALAVRFAHQKGIRVIPLVGPSSILLALMASGLNGQRFAFQGYLPIPEKERTSAIRTLEKESRIRSQTEIFIETPYRNNALFESLVNTLLPDTRLCVALDVTGENEFIVTRTIREWRSEQAPALPKRPAVFLFLA